MKNLIRVFGVLVFSLFIALPAFAVSEGAGKTMTLFEFSALPENHGAGAKLTQKRYDDYRSGRWVITTLETSRLR